MPALRLLENHAGVLDKVAQCMQRRPEPSPVQVPWVSELQLVAADVVCILHLVFEVREEGEDGRGRERREEEGGGGERREEEGGGGERRGEEGEKEGRGGKRRGEERKGEEGEEGKGEEWRGGDGRVMLADM